MNYLITSAITALIIAGCFLYQYEIVLPVKREMKDNKKQPLNIEWIDFIHANINSCFTEYHIHQCRKLIILFEQKFRNQIPPHVFSDCVESLFNRLDTRYKTIRNEDDRLSNLTADDALKKIMEE